MVSAGLTVVLAVGVPIAAVVVTIPAFFLLRRYLQGPTLGSDADTRLDEKVAVVTGANTGIGKETARELYLRGARVLALCRSRKRAEEAISDIVDGHGSNGALGSIEFVQCDLSSLDSIRKAAEEVGKRVKKIDILINNAGLYGSGAAKTEDGFNLTFGVNHLGTFLLTELLMPLVLAAAPNKDESDRPKIINVSSMAHNAFPLQLDKMDFDGPVTDMEAWYEFMVDCTVAYRSIVNDVQFQACLFEFQVGQHLARERVERSVPPAHQHLLVAPWGRGHRGVQRYQVVHPDFYHLLQVRIMLFNHIYSAYVCFSKCFVFVTVVIDCCCCCCNSCWCYIAVVLL